MADRGTEDWLPAGWTVSMRVRRSGKKDKHYFGPRGQRFYSKVEVTRYLKTVECDSPQLKKEKDTILEESTGDASACAIQKERPNTQEKGKLGIELSSQNLGSPESEEKYYSAQETVEDECGNVVQSGSLNPEDKGNAKPEQPAEHCIYHPKSDMDQALIVKEFAQNVCGSTMEAAKSKENCSAHQSKEAKNVNDEESADRICSTAAENGSHQSEEEENRILEESRKDARDSVERGCSKEKKRARPKQSANVVVETSVAEGLPDGWIKEVKVKKKNNVVRKDSYYIDPVSGYIFRSMKDALRYLATGDIGRLAFKRKDMGDCGAELEDDKCFSPAETKKQKLHENGTNSEDMRSKQTRLHNADENQATTIGGSATDLSATDPLKLRGSEQKEERKNTNEIDSTPANEVEAPLNEHLPIGRTGEMAALADKALLPRDELLPESTEDTPSPAEVAGIPPFEQPQESIEKTSASAREMGVLQDEKSSQRMEETQGNKTTPQSTPKSRKKKALDLPRRTSNRLAGVSVDSGVEVTRTRAQRGAFRKLDEGEATGAKSVITRGCSQLQPKNKRTRRGNKLSEPMAGPGPSGAAWEEDAKKLERDQVDDEKTGKNATTMPQENVSAIDHAEKLKADDESEEKPVLPFELPSGDILSDPCIEFAIKTLTGIDFDASKSTPKSRNGSNSLRDAASLKVQAEQMEIEKEVDKKQAPPDKYVSRVYNHEEKLGADVPSSSLSSLPFRDSWQDPCIEFAIKTLTGAIPVDYDMDINDLMRQQIRSSQIQESSEVALSNTGLDNFTRTDVLWQHFNDSSPVKTDHRQHTGVAPIAPQSGYNLNLQKTGGAVLRQHLQSRGNKYQR